MNHCTKASSTSFDFALASWPSDWGQGAVGKKGPRFPIVLSGHISVPTGETKASPQKSPARQR